VQEREGISLNPPQIRERRDFRPRGAALGLAALVLLLAVFLAGMAHWYQSFFPRARAPAPVVPGSSPYLEAEFESGALREHWYSPQRERLKTYGWVNREAGIAHIPLQRAMEIEAGGKGGAP
jgi:uncharacterized protein (DUF58 family)